MPAASHLLFSYASVLLFALLTKTSSGAEVRTHDSCSVAGNRLIQRRSKIDVLKLSSSAPKTVGWNFESLSAVRTLLSGTSLPDWAAHASDALSKQAKKVLSLPANLREGVRAGPWSVTDQGPTPPFPGENREYTTVSGYYWPCHEACPSSYDNRTCAKGWGASTPTECNQTTGMPWVKHDGFLRKANLEDLDAMIVMMDTVETLTLAWWLLPEHEMEYAETAVRVLRSWFFNETTGMLPKLLFGGGIPGIYDGTAGAIIAPSFRLGTRLSDCIELLKTADSSVWSVSDNTNWNQWAKSWLQWLQTSTFGKNELDAVGNHATFLYSHKLAMAKATGQDSIILELSKRLRTAYAGSLAEQIVPSGEMPVETRRITGATYSMMNLKGLFLLGEAMENACHGLNCSPVWDWSWEVSEKTEGNWEQYPNMISYCRYKGRGSTDSIEACQASCMINSNCNGVVTRHKYGSLVGCYFKYCPGTLYRHRSKAPRANVYVSYHYIEGPPVGSGSVRKALDFMRAYALGRKDWAVDFPKTIDGDASWREMALTLRIASIKYRNVTYEAEIAEVDPQKWFSKWTWNSLLFPPLEIANVTQ